MPHPILATCPPVLRLKEVGGDLGGSYSAAPPHDTRPSLNMPRGSRTLHRPSIQASGTFGDIQPTSQSLLKPGAISKELRDNMAGTLGKAEPRLYRLRARSHQPGSRLRRSFAIHNASCRAGHSSFMPVDEEPDLAIYCSGVQTRRRARVCGSLGKGVHHFSQRERCPKP